MAGWVPVLGGLAVLLASSCDPRAPRKSDQALGAKETHAGRAGADPEDAASDAAQARAGGEDALLSGSGARRASDDAPDRTFEHEFEDDPETLAILRRIGDEVSLIGRVTPGHVRTLQALYRRWPNSDRVVGAYDRGLRSRSDWDALIQLHEPRMITHPVRDMNRYMSELLIEAKRFKKAMGLLETLRAADPEDPEIAWLLAKAAFGMGDVVLARSTLDASWKRLIATGNTDAMFLRGLIHFHEDRLDEAERSLHDVLDIHPNHVSANNTLGRVLVARGRAAEAAPFLNRARHLQDGINARERAALERVSRWQGVADACGESTAGVGTAGARACEPTIRAALRVADGPLKQALYAKLVAFYRASNQSAKADQASAALQALQDEQP